MGLGVDPRRQRRKEENFGTTVRTGGFHTGLI